MLHRNLQPTCCHRRKLDQGQEHHLDHQNHSRLCAHYLHRCLVLQLQHLPPYILDCRHLQSRLLRALLYLPLLRYHCLEPEHSASRLQLLQEGTRFQPKRKLELCRLLLSQYFRRFGTMRHFLLQSTRKNTVFLAGWRFLLRLDAMRNRQQLRRFVFHPLLELRLANRIPFQKSLFVVGHPSHCSPNQVRMSATNHNLHSLDYLLLKAVVVTLRTTHLHIPKGVAHQ